LHSRGLQEDEMSEINVENNNINYDENQILVLEGLEAQEKTGDVYRYYISQRSASPGI